jgi:hypothetical protein
MSKTDAQRIGWVLRRFGLSQGALAESIGYGGSYVSEVTHGKKPISAEMAVRVAGQYGVRLDWLLTGEGEPYAYGPDATMAPRPTSKVVRRIAYFCGLCNGQVAPGMKECHHCGGEIDWTEETS